MSLFKQKKEGAGVIVFVMLVSGGVLLSLSVLTVYFGRLNSRPAPPAPVVVRTPEELTAAYLASIRALAERVQKSSTAEAAFSQLEETLFTIQVPREWLDRHFQAVIAVRKLQESAAGMGVEEVRLEASRILQNLPEKK